MVHEHLEQPGVAAALPEDDEAPEEGQAVRAQAPPHLARGQGFPLGRELTLLTHSSAHSPLWRGAFS